jgi:hypothetical protein
MAFFYTILCGLRQRRSTEYCRRMVNLRPPPSPHMSSWGVLRGSSPRGLLIFPTPVYTSINTFFIYYLLFYSLMYICDWFFAYIAFSFAAFWLNHDIKLQIYIAAPNWATGLSTELHCTLLSYSAPTELLCRVPTSELHGTPYGLGHPNCAMLHPILSYAVPYCAPLYPTELRNSLWTTLKPNWATYNTFVQFIKMPECRTVR